MHKVLIFMVLSVILFNSCNTNGNESKNGGGQSKAVSFIEGYVVKPQLLENTLSVSGTVKPFEETVLMPDIQARVTQINIIEGSFVQKGTLLVKLFDDDLQAQLQKLKIQLKIAELNASRQLELRNVEGVSQNELDQAQLQVNSINGDIGIVKAQIRKTEVLAPFDGVLGLRNISVGAIVYPTTQLLTIREVNKLKLDFSIPGTYSGEIRPGMKIKFSILGNDLKFEASVLATEEGIDASSRNFKVRAIINSVHPSLQPGAFASVEIKINENKKVLAIPSQAIIPQERNKKVIVAHNGNATYIVVKTGLRKDSLVEILNGLSAGDTVVTTGIMFIKPGSGLSFSKVVNK